LVIARHPPFGEGDSNWRQSLEVWVSGTPDEPVSITDEPVSITVEQALRPNSSIPNEQELAFVGRERDQ
jgi:hypothetical protein